MNWLTQNGLATMPGPRFLALYACVIAIVFIWSVRKARRADPTREMEPMPIPSQPDPYEIAYLRGGENEVLRLVIFTLVQRGYLESANAGLKQRDRHPDVRHLSNIEDLVFETFAERKSPREIFGDTTLRKFLIRFCEFYKKQLVSKSLLHPDTSAGDQLKLCLQGVGVILILGGYKLWAALSTGHYNVGFLVAMAIGSSLALILVCKSYYPRATWRGRVYLERVKIAFEKLKDRVCAVEPDSTDPLLLLVVSLFGLSVLADTAHASLFKMFEKSAQTNFRGPEADCGSCSSTGGSSCGGGGDGGGSSCGGGGCGGCGGGGD